MSDLPIINDLSRKNLTNNIRSITISKRVAKREKDNWVAGDSNGLVSFEEYNEAGMCHKTTFRYPDLKVTGILEGEFRLNMVHKHFYYKYRNDSYVLQNLISYFYLEDNTVLFEVEENEMLKSKGKVWHNISDQKIKQEDYAVDSKLLHTTYWEYDAERNLVRKHKITASEELIEDIRYSYLNYDEQGNWKQRFEWVNNKDYHYEADKKKIVLHVVTCKENRY